VRVLKHYHPQSVAARGLSTRGSYAGGGELGVVPKASLGCGIFPGRLGGTVGCLLRRPNIKARTPMAANPTTEPTPIPALAPVESPLSVELLVGLLPPVGLIPLVGELGLGVRVRIVAMVPCTVTVKTIVLVTSTLA
jgi:hypothetical protein